MKSLILSIIVAGCLLCSCSVKGPICVTSNEIGSKTGVASRTIWFGIRLGTTDLSLTTAAKNGGITSIATVDWQVKGGLFKKTYSTIVTGE